MHSVYVHIPFCAHICTYCDFCKMYYDEKNVDAYFKELQREIKLYYKGEPIKTLYIGGGTPSCLEELPRLFKILSAFFLEEKYEFTFECNIEDITEDKLLLLKQNGVNRLSIGVQSFTKKHLSFLGRNHTKEEVIEKIQLAKNIGFQNISVDLMYAFPSQTSEELKENLMLYLDLNIPHISAYSLILEPHTVLYINGIEPISEEIDRQMYDQIVTVLAQNGYEQYEVSNFAKKGYASMHNLTYWNNQYYYGFGLGASGYIDDIRYENTRSLSHYLEGNYRYQEEKVNTQVKEENEYILGFRKIKGISISLFRDKFQKDIHQNKTIQKLLKENKLIEANGFIYVNPNYIYVMNEFLNEFLEG